MSHTSSLRAYPRRLGGMPPRARIRKLAFGWSFLWAILAVATLVQAQPPQPVVTFVFPAGAERGKTIEATVNGKDFQNASGVRITGPGVTAKVVQVVNPNAVRVSVAVAPDAELGERDLRLITPGGVSNRLRFFIGALPEVNEVEPNTDRTKPQALAALPILINGQIVDNDRDNYRFAAKAGQTIVCAVQARTLLPYLPDTVPGFLDTSLTLFDSGGKVLVSVDRFRHNPDSVLVYTVPQDGEYTLEISDVIYRGRADFIYRLSIGVFPYLTHVFPLGGQLSSAVQLELHGVNLFPESILFAPPRNGLAARYVSVARNGLTSNALLFAVSDVREVRETEPNDAPAQANRVALPAAINGRIQQPGDVDHFIVTAQANQVLVLDVQARRLDSPLDSLLTVMNAQGGVLAESDDFTDPDTPLVLHHADSRLVFAFPAAGDYLLRVRDTQGKGGEEYAYRLVVGPPRPDYSVRIIPDNIRLAQGDTGVITVSSLRKDGFGGEIAVAPQTLPPGFAATDTVIPAGQDTARLTITAPRDAPLTAFPVTMVGTATLNNQPLMRTVVGAEDVMQAFSYRHIIPTKEFLVAVMEAPSFTLALSAPPKEPLQVAQATEVQVAVKAFRKDTAKGPITLAIDGPPPGITIKPAVIPPDKDEMAVTIVVAKEAAVGLRHNIILNGTLKTDKETSTRLAPAVPVKVVAPPPPPPPPAPKK